VEQVEQAAHTGQLQLRHGNCAHTHIHARVRACSSGHLGVVQEVRGVRAAVHAGYSVLAPGTTKRVM